MNRLDAIRWAAAAYNLLPAPGVQRIAWRDVTADVFEIGGALGVAVQGTNPEKLANLVRDANVRGEPCRDHPKYGPMFAGALDAAQGLVPLILGLAGDRQIFPLGHSLGGQIAIDLAGEFIDRLLGFWGFDNPKSGDEQFAAAMAHAPGNIDRFDGSIVTHWPFAQGVHVRPPVLIGEWSPSWLTAHSIERAAAWVAAQDQSTPALLATA